MRRRVGTWVHRLVARLVAPHVRREVEGAEARAFARAREAALGEPLVFGPTERLHVDATAQLNDALLNTESGTITVARYAFLGHRVTVVTGTHDIDERGLARQLAVPDAGRDVVIEEGAWIGSGAILVGPCRIGAHAVVGAGAVVTADVAAETVVAGVPARVVRAL